MCCQHKQPQDCSGRLPEWCATFSQCSLANPQLLCLYRVSRLQPSGTPACLLPRKRLLLLHSPLTCSRALWSLFPHHFNLFLNSQSCTPLPCPFRASSMAMVICFSERIPGPLPHLRLHLWSVGCRLAHFLAEQLLPL